LCLFLLFSAKHLAYLNIFYNFADEVAWKNVLFWYKVAWKNVLFWYKVAWKNVICHYKVAWKNVKTIDKELIINDICTKEKLRVSC
jgi:hypothetical protein